MTSGEILYSGPYDSSDAASPADAIDFGSLLIPPDSRFGLRVDVEAGTDRIVGLTIDVEGSSLQIQAFAAPKSEPIWHAVAKDLADSLKAQGVEAQIEIGPFGAEVLTNGVLGEDKPMRFVGFDGPRWFLRGTISGLALTEPDAKFLVENVFKSIVVHRGDHPVPPRALLEISMPPGAIAPGLRP
jgi:hypothetical protein